jgi:subtilisin family serine protease
MEPEDYIVLRGVATWDEPASKSPSFDAFGGVPGDDPSMRRVLRYGTERVESVADVTDLEKDPEVLSVAPVMPTILHAPINRDTSADPRTEVTWGVAAVNANESPWDGSGITVAVLDTGITVEHPAFEGRDMVQRDFTGEGDGDRHGHGTHCAGTIFGRDVEGLRIGIAPAVERVLIGKVLQADGTGSTDSIVNGILWAVDEGAHVISLSLGLDFPGLVRKMVEEDGYPVDLATSVALERYTATLNVFRPLGELAIQRASNAGRGTVLVAAGGNESQRQMNPDYRVTVGPPANDAHFISVGALGQTEAGLAVAPFSNSGPRVSAPGVDIVSARSGGGLETMDGTSMAVPHVAGVAALWAQRQMATVGTTDSFSLTSLVAGSSTLTGLRGGATSMDVGLGLVQAPV